VITKKRKYIKISWFEDFV
jgi:hypothetical protein